MKGKMESEAAICDIDVDDLHIYWQKLIAGVRLGVFFFLWQGKSTTHFRKRCVNL
jgi:hypothetical protein